MIFFVNVKKVKVLYIFFFFVVAGGFAAAKLWFQHFRYYDNNFLHSLGKSQKKVFFSGLSTMRVGEGDGVVH